MNLKVTVKEFGSVNVMADSVAAVPGTGVVQFLQNGPTATPTVLWVALSELVMVEVLPEVMTKTAEPAAAAEPVPEPVPEEQPQ
jgi:hypothetical protein